MSRRLLLVEDESAIRDVVAISLERVGGWEVAGAASGAAALELAERGERFDAVLLDVMMPGLDGPATLERLRQVPGWRSTPAVFLTAKLQPGDCARLRAAGAAGVIAKPFDPIALPGQLGRALAGAGADGCRDGGGAAERGAKPERVEPELAEIWARSRAAIEARMEAIELALAGSKPRSAGAAAAHSLAGLLGSFGLHRAGELARRLERGIEAAGSGAASPQLKTEAAKLRGLLGSDATASRSAIARGEKSG